MPRIPISRSTISEGKRNYFKPVLLVIIIASAAIATTFILFFAVDWTHLEEDQIDSPSLVDENLPAWEEYQPITNYGWIDKGTAAPAYMPMTIRFDGYTGFKATSAYDKETKVYYDLGSVNAVNFTYKFTEAAGASRGTATTSFAGFEFLDSSGNIVFRFGVENIGTPATSYLKWYSSSSTGRVKDMGGFTYYDRVQFTIEYRHGSISIVPVKLSNNFSPISSSTFTVVDVPIAGVQYHSTGLQESLVYYDLNMVTAK